MELETPTAAMLGTVAGLSFIVTIVTEIILRAAQPSAAAKDRYGPFLALAIAAVLAIVAAVTQGGDLLGAVLLAIVTAGTGMGIHDTVSATTKSA